MLNKNNKAQIGETITWLVATIIIIVILAISVFITSASRLKDKDNLKLIDKQKDFIATKSIVNFLIENFDLVKVSIESKSYYESLEEKFRPFLESLIVFRGIGGWNFELYLDGKKEFPGIITSSTVGWYSYYDIYFNLRPKIKLRFWEDCQGLCQ